MYVFTRDLERLIADLRATGDEVAVIRRYKDALVSRCEVCWELRSGFVEDLLMYPKACQSVRKTGKNEASRQRDRACSGP